MTDRSTLPREALVRIYVNGDFFSTLLCTPRDLKELAVGWLYNEGLVQTMDEITALFVKEDLQEIHFHLGTDRQIESRSERVIRTSACMGGTMSYSSFFRRLRTPEEGPTVSSGALKSLMRKTLAQATLYRITGGIHCAGIASDNCEASLSVFEDVGRHNAFDKVIGRMLLSGDPPESKILLTSGRISSEMALKAVYSEIPVVASISTATDLAVTIAEDAGLTLVGRVMSTSPAVLCGGQRISHVERLQMVHSHSTSRRISRSRDGDTAE
jgi:FdhD protein